MFQDIFQQLTDGSAEIPGEQMLGHVDSLLGQASSDHTNGAIGDALQALGPQGFGQSVAQAAQGMSPRQQQGLVGMLGQAIEGNGGSLSGVLGSLGIGGGGAGGGGFSPSEIGALASHVLQNHGSSLGSVLGSRTSGGGSSVVGLLGNPMVRQVGMSLAKRLMSGNL